FKRREAGVRRRRRSVHVRLLNVDGIKSAVSRVTRIKGDANDAGGVARIGHKLRKYLPKSDVGRKFLTRLVQDVQRAALIDDEKTGSGARCVCRLGAHAIDAA